MLAMTKREAAMTAASVTLSAAKGLADSSPLAQNDKGMTGE